MLSVTNKPFMLSVIRPNVIMWGVIMLSVLAHLWQGNHKTTMFGQKLKN